MHTQKDKKIIVHIGALTTGSTAIQTFCNSNFDALEKQGIYYPRFKGNKKFRRSPLGRDRAANGNLLCARHYDENELKKILEKFETDPDIHTMLLSEELLFLSIYQGTRFHPDAIKFLQKYNTHIVVFLRNTTEYITGTWQESVRSINSKSLHHHIHNYNYTDCLEYLYYLRQKFGHQKVHLELYNEPNPETYNSIAVLLKHLHYESHQTESEKIRVNSAVARDYLESLRIINSVLGCKLPQEYKQYIPIYSKHTVHESLSDKEINTIVDKHASIEKKIAQDFFNRDKLFENPYPEHYLVKRKAYKFHDRALKKRMLRPLIKRIFCDIYYKKNKFISSVIFYSILMLPASARKKCIKILRNE